jgi:hypothetical protein
MSLDYLVWGIGGIYLFGLIITPFPHWPTYFHLWGVLLTGDWGWNTKLRQASYLIKMGARAPFGGLFWYMDELLFPGYRKQNITPVFIIGQPRCGTTFLHRTLAKDTDNFFAVRHLEWRYPSITQRKLIQILGMENRLLSSNYWSDTTDGQLAARMHPNTLADPEEDGIFYEENYLHHFFIYLRFPCPQLLDRLDGFVGLSLKTKEKMLANHRKTLQKVAYQRGTGNCFYLSKEVTSNYRIPALQTLYPNARFIVAVRSAGSFMASLFALMRTSTISKIGVDPIQISGWKEGLAERMRRECNLLVQLSRDKIPETRQVLVSSGDVFGEIDFAISVLYQSLDLSMSDSFKTILKDNVEKQKNRQSGYTYTSQDPRGFEVYEKFVREVSAGMPDRTGFSSL